MPLVRVVTYNVLGARHGAALARVIRSLAPDVIVVNEGPKLPWLWRLRCRRLARRWGLRMVAGGRVAGGNMVCVSDRVEVGRTSVRRLPQARFQPRRGMVAVECTVGGVGFWVVGVHLSLNPRSRVAEADAVVSFADGLRGPVVLAGDLNEIPGRPAWRAFADAGFEDHADAEDRTFTSADRRKRIDALLVRDTVVRSHVVPDLPPEHLEAASDHCPVLAEIDVANG